LSNNVADVLEQVLQLGFKPATIIDVGVASGTTSLYRAFPEAFHLLIEPLEEFNETIQELLRSYRSEFIQAAASSTDGELMINVHKEHLAGSSIFKEEMGPEFDGELRKVKSVRIDTIVREKGLKGPFLMKIDVQGAEEEVLKGAQETLNDTEIVLLEVSLFEFMKGAPQFAEVVEYMKQHKFVVYDVYGGAKRPLDDALGQVDVAFVKEQGMFRTDHRYATADQWQKMTT